MLLFAIAALVAIDNKVFIDTSSEQLKQGYTWKYVGKNAPSGTPAITIKPEHGEPYIIYRLEK
tara:strand:- start:11133 stop:11321 length:189 start_codon:yes stop_codon:yes gene_type:complete